VQGHGAEMRQAQADDRGRPGRAPPSPRYRGRPPRFGDARQVQGGCRNGGLHHRRGWPRLIIVRWTEPEQGTSVTHFQDWNKLELLASVASGKGEFVQMLGTLAETRPRSAP
jgi:hypothetical protein